MNDNEIIQQYKKYEPFFGSWYLKRFIGEGSFAKVFEIVRNDFGSEYSSALKIITVSKTKTEIDAMKSEGMSEQEIRESLKAVVEDTVREIQLMYQLRGNGNIVGYEDHSVMEHEDGLGWDIFIKMEFLTSLNSYIQSGEGKLSRRDIIKLGADICKALETCQKFNITHRDIKSDNIFISGTGDFKLGDFGIARIIERKDTELSRKGTSAYMAPEVYKGQSYTSAVDIYSLGIVLYRLLNHNRGPFLPEYPKPISLDERDRALVMRMSGEKFPRPTQAGEGRLADIVLKACAYRPEERYASPVFMRQELEGILYDGTETGNDELLAVAEESDRSMAAVTGEKPKETSAGEYEATEVLREESTPLGEIPVIPGEAEVKILCKKCGNAINRDSAFCPICGASQREKGKTVPIRKMPKEKPAPVQKMPKERSGEKNSKKLMTIWKTQKAPIIGGICAVILVIVVIIGVSGSGSSSKSGKDKTNTGALVSNESTAPSPSSKPTTEPKPTAEPKPTTEPKTTEDASASWNRNVIQEESYDSSSILGSDIEKSSISLIIFLDTLDGMPDNAWDVSADGSGKVMAWTVKDSDYPGDTLYIGGEGGVAANTNCFYFFGRYSRLKEIQINGNFHTDNVTTMAWMFYDCPSLSSLDLSDFNTSNVVDMSGMFCRCESLTGIDVSSFDTSKVTDMGSMFSGCKSLISVDVSGFDTSKVTDMSLMFDGCESLTSVDVSGFDTSNVTNMWCVFSYCESLSSLDVSGFDTSKVTEMNHMFGGCSSLTNLDVGGFDTSKVTDMSYMFSNCVSLTGLNVSGFKISKDTNVQSMFLGCRKLTGVDVSNFPPELVETMELTSSNTAGVQPSQPVQPSPSPSPQPAQPSPSPSPSSQPSQAAPSQNPEPSGPPPGGSGEERPDRPPQPT